MPSSLGAVDLLVEVLEGRRDLLRPLLGWPPEEAVNVVVLHEQLHEPRIVVVPGHLEGLDLGENLGIDRHSLDDLLVTDSNIVDTGTAIPLTYDCVRSHPIMLDGFELGGTSRWLKVP